MHILLFSSDRLLTLCETLLLASVLYQVLPCGGHVAVVEHWLHVFTVTGIMLRQLVVIVEMLIP